MKVHLNYSQLYSFAINSPDTQAPKTLKSIAKQITASIFFLASEEGRPTNYNTHLLSNIQLPIESDIDNNLMYAIGITVSNYNYSEANEGALDSTSASQTTIPVNEICSTVRKDLVLRVFWNLVLSSHGVYSTHPLNDASQPFNFASIIEGLDAISHCINLPNDETTLSAMLPDHIRHAYVAQIVNNFRKYSTESALTTFNTDYSLRSQLLAPQADSTINTDFVDSPNKVVDAQDDLKIPSLEKQPNILKRLFYFSVNTVANIDRQCLITASKQTVMLTVGIYGFHTGSILSLGAATIYGLTHLRQLAPFTASHLAASSEKLYTTLQQESDLTTYPTAQSSLQVTHNTAAVQAIREANLNNAFRLRNEARLLNKHYMQAESYLLQAMYWIEDMMLNTQSSHAFNRTELEHLHEALQYAKDNTDNIQLNYASRFYHLSNGAYNAMERLQYDIEAFANNASRVNISHIIALANDLQLAPEQIAANNAHMSQIAQNGQQAYIVESTILSAINTIFIGFLLYKLILLCVCVEEEELVSIRNYLQSIPSRLSRMIRGLCSTQVNDSNPELINSNRLETQTQENEGELSMQREPHSFSDRLNEEDQDTTIIGDTEQQNQQVATIVGNTEQQNQQVERIVDAEQQNQQAAAIVDGEQQDTVEVAEDTERTRLIEPTQL